MTVQRRNIFEPSIANRDVDYAGAIGPGGTADDETGTTAYLSPSNGPMGETGVDDNTTARHQGIVSAHQAATARETGRAVPGDQTGAGMVIGTSSPLVTEGGDGGHGDHDADAPNQGTPMKTIAGSDGFSTSGEGDSGDQTGAGKVLG